MLINIDDKLIISTASIDFIAHGADGQIEIYISGRQEPVRVGGDKARRLFAFMGGNMCALKATDESMMEAQKSTASPLVIPKIQGIA